MTRDYREFFLCKYKYIYRILLCPLVLMSIYAQPAAANVPLIPAGYGLGFPLLLTIRSIGIGLLLIVLIEGLWIYRAIPNLSPGQSLLSALIANLWSTLFGALALFAYGSGLIILPGAVVLAVIMGHILSRLIRQEYLPIRSFRSDFLAFLFWFLLFLIVVPGLGLLTMPEQAGWVVPPNAGFESVTEVMIALAAGAGLLLIGMAASVLIETWSFRRHLTQGNYQGIQAIARANLLSYIVGVIVFIIVIKMSNEPFRWYIERSLDR